MTQIPHENNLEEKRLVLDLQCQMFSQWMPTPLFWVCGEAEPHGERTRRKATQLLMARKHGDRRRSQGQDELPKGMPPATYFLQRCPPSDPSRCSRGHSCHDLIISPLDICALPHTSCSCLLPWVINKGWVILQLKGWVILQLNQVFSSMVNINLCFTVFKYCYMKFLWSHDFWRLSGTLGTLWLNASFHGKDSKPWKVCSLSVPEVAAELEPGAI